MQAAAADAGEEAAAAVAEPAEPLEPAAAHLTRPAEADVIRIRALLGRLQREVAKHNAQAGGPAGKQVSVSLLTEEVELLQHLFELGLIRAPSSSVRGGGAWTAPKEEDALAVATLFKKVRGELMWPVNIVFSELGYSVKLPAKARGIETVWSKLVGLVTPLARLARCRLQPEMREHFLLKELTGRFRAGSPTLVLGPPGCGVSTLFKVLSARAPVGGAHAQYGRLLYSGFSAQEKRVRSMVNYVDQNDNNLAAMTVRETLEFARSLTRREMLVSPTAEAAAEEIAFLRKVWDEWADVMIKAYGLSKCQDTVVGNEVMRGVSGGERRRVTTAEIAVTMRPAVFYDQISTGLDSAATFDVCKRITSISRLVQTTAVVSLLQPSPETFALFDELLVLCRGRTVYQGRRELALGYFESLGFKCPEMTDIADFIQSVTTSNRALFRAAGAAGAAAPDSDEAMVAAWLASAQARELRADCEALTGKVESALADSVFGPGSSPYALPAAAEMPLVVRRNLLLLARDKGFVIARIVQSIFMGIVFGTVFFQLDPAVPVRIEPGANVAAVSQRYGLVMLALMQGMLGSMASLFSVITMRPVFYKQSGGYFYRAISYVAGETLSAIPLALAEGFLQGTLVFWLSGIVPNTAPDVVAQYFFFLWSIVLLNVSFGALMRLVGALAPSPGVAQIVAAVCVLLNVLFGGFMVSFDVLPPWFIWIYWLVPFSWQFRSLMVFIFSSPYWSAQQQTFALALFGLDGFPRTAYVYAAWGVLVGYWGLCITLSWLAYRLVRVGGASALRPPEQLEEQLVVKERDLRASALSLAASGSIGDKLEDQQQDQQQGQRPGQHPGSAVVLVEGDSKPSQSPPPPEQQAIPVPECELVREQSQKVLASANSPVTIVFRDLWYTVKDPRDPHETIDLLKGINGYMKAGTMTALMGSSGAGKTTLMDVIAGRKNSGKIKGEILVNGRAKKQATFARIMGYCEQMDIHSPLATVREALEFSAHLRQDAAVPFADKMAFAEAVMDVLELAKIQGLLVGEKGAGGLSTEQAKRLTIGVELAANPSVLFADEPTSGLDSKSSATIMRCIKRVAASGRTVVCTIHQPSRDIFQGFDRLLLLRRGGETVFFGELGPQSQLLVDYLLGVPGTKPMPDTRYNPANWMLEVIGAGTAAAILPAADYAQEFRASLLAARALDEIDALVAHDLEDKQELAFDTPYPTGLAEQFRALLRKWNRTYYRSVNYNVPRVIINVVLALLFGGTFFRVVIATPSAVQSFMGIIFLAANFLGILGTNTTVPVLYSERTPYYRERAAGMYSALPYVVAYTLAELPYLVLASAAFVPIFYFMTGLSYSASNFFLWWFTFFLFMTCMVFWGQALAASLPTPQVATLVAGVSSGLFGLFSGFTIAVSDMPNFWKFMPAINPMRYAFVALTQIQLACDCATMHEFVPNASRALCSSSKGPVLCATVCDSPAVSPGCSLVPTTTNVTTGWSVYITAYAYQSAQWGISSDMIAGSIGALVGWCVLYRAIAALSLAFVNHSTR